jgi:hypothetical protein
MVDLFIVWFQLPESESLVQPGQNDPIYDQRHYNRHKKDEDRKDDGQLNKSLSPGFFNLV